MREDLVWLSGEVVDINMITSVESNLNVKFPDDYIKCIKDNDEAYPDPSAFYLENKSLKTFNNLISINNSNKITILSLWDKFFKDKYPNIIPFGRDPGGNLICFDFRFGKTCPQIVYYNHELEVSDNNLIKVSDNFSEFINSLFSDDVSF